MSLTPSAFSNLVVAARQPFRANCERKCAFGCKNRNPESECIDGCCT